MTRNSVMPLEYTTITIDGHEITHLKKFDASEILKAVKSRKLIRGANSHDVSTASFKIRSKAPRRFIGLFKIPGKINVNGKFVIRKFEDWNDYNSNDVFNRLQKSALSGLSVVELPIAIVKPRDLEKPTYLVTLWKKDLQKPDGYFQGSDSVKNKLKVLKGFYTNLAKLHAAGLLHTHVVNNLGVDVKRKSGKLFDPTQVIEDRYNQSEHERHGMSYYFGTKGFFEKAGTTENEMHAHYDRVYELNKRKRSS